MGSGIGTVVSGGEGRGIEYGTVDKHACIIYSTVPVLNNSYINFKSSRTNLTNRDTCVFFFF